ncbi:MAG TPA: hypothetical protein VM694_43040 [Polyangium sp.]|nr:hypothetical protein [Polyangium sp.]
MVSGLGDGPAFETLNENDFAPLSSVTLIVSSSTRPKLIWIERSLGSASLYVPACGTGSTQRSSTPSIARSHVPPCPVHARAPST